VCVDTRTLTAGCRDIDNQLHEKNNLRLRLRLRIRIRIRLRPEGVLVVRFRLRIRRLSLGQWSMEGVW